MFSIPTGYVDAVRNAGASPLILPPGEAEPGRLLDLLGGLIVSGGGDIAPTAYGADPQETVYQVSDERDQFEFSLTRSALTQPEIPLLFICRGMQVLNIVCGGTLHVHLPDQFGETIAHRLPPREPTLHEVRIDQNSRLASILGATRVEACSWHHQCIDRLGDRLRPVAWAEDGVIEAIEHTEHPWCVAVQWHPEMQLDDLYQMRLFRALADAVKWKTDRATAIDEKPRGGGRG